jgi:hypothetical protein
LKGLNIETENRQKNRGFGFFKKSRFGFGFLKVGFGFLKVGFGSVSVFSSRFRVFVSVFA